MLLASAAFASGVGIRLADAMLPKLAETFDTSLGIAAQAVGIYAIGYGLFQLFYGPLGDRHGKFRVIAFAALASTVGNIGAALATSMDQLIFFRFLGGVTAAGIIPLCMAWIGDAVPYENRQSVLAKFLSGSILGMLIGQMAGGFFADTLGWRAAFGALAMIFLAVALLLFNEQRRSSQSKDSAAIRTKASSWKLLPSIFQTPWARLILFVVFMEGVAAFGALAFIPSYLHGRFGISLTAAGSILGLFGLGALSYTLFSKYLIQKFGETGLTLAGGLVLGCAFIGLVVAPSWAWAMPACFGCGLGYYLLHNTLQVNATQMVPHARGTAVSLFAASLFFGQAIGVAGAAAVADRAGIVWVFIFVGFVLPMLGLFFSSAIRRRQTMINRSPSEGG